MCSSAVFNHQIKGVVLVWAFLLMRKTNGNPINKTLSTFALLTFRVILWLSFPCYCAQGAPTWRQSSITPRTGPSPILLRLPSRLHAPTARNAEEMRTFHVHVSPKSGVLVYYPSVVLYCTLTVLCVLSALSSVYSTGVPFLTALSLFTSVLVVRDPVSKGVKPVAAQQHNNRT